MRPKSRNEGVKKEKANAGKVGLWSELGEDDISKHHLALVSTLRGIGIVTRGEQHTCDPAFKKTGRTVMRNLIMRGLIGIFWRPGEA